jgi:uncharacterized membrane protein
MRRKCCTTSFLEVNKTRFESFSDGVFAFALTLLVLSFAVPMNGAQKWTTDALLARHLAALWPNLVAYVLSFAVIGIMWQNHHALMRTVEIVDRKTVLLNMLLLGCTVFIPFASATLGAYPAMHASTFLYGLILTACATCYNGILNHLVRARRFNESFPESAVSAAVRAYRVGWVTYGLATLVALVSPPISFGLYLAIVAYYLIPRGVDDDIATPA